MDEEDEVVGGLSALGAGTQTDPQTQGLMSLLAQPFMTTPEAQEQARGILDRYQESGFGAEEDILARMKETAESSRKALMDARDRLMGRPDTSKQELFFNMAQQFLAPSRTGFFSENLSGATGALSQHVQTQRQEQRQREKDLLAFDQGLSNIDQQMLESEMALAGIKRKSEGDLAVEALKTLGRAVPRPGAGLSGVIPENIKVRDREYITQIYTPWTTGGSAEAGKSVYALKAASKELRSGNDKLTGPIVGTVASLDIPYVGEVGRGIQDIIWPKGANVREMVEENVQKSLRTILGSQFTEREGAALLRRVFNPRLDESVIADRVDRLIEQLEGALEEKNRSARYFESYGTLLGYQPRQFSWQDFEPTPILIDVNMPDGGVLRDVPDNTSPADMEALYQQQKNGERPGYAKGGKVARAHLLIDKLTGKIVHPGSELTDFRGGRAKFLAITRANEAELGTGNSQGKILVESLDENGNPTGKTMEYYPSIFETRVGYPQGIKRVKRNGGRIKYAQGGTVDFADIIAGEEQSQLGPTQPESGGVNDLLLALIGGGTGSLVGPTLSDAMSRLEEMARPSVPNASRAERAIMEGMETGGEDMAKTAASVKRARRIGIPATMLTEGKTGTQIVGERAMTQGGQRAEDAIVELEDVKEGARGRVAERVNKSLKPYPYFDQLARLTDDLYSNAKPMYQAVYEKFPGIPEAQIPALKEIFDSPDGKRAVRIALRILRNQGKTIGPQDAVGLVHSPSLEFMDLVKRGMDQIIFKEEVQGPTPLGRSMRELRTRLRDQLDEATDGEYKAARMQYAGDLEVLDALQAGREEFAHLQPEELTAKLGEMSAAEKTAFKTGVAQRLYEMIHNPGSDINPAQKLIGSPAMDQKLAMLFNRQSEARLFRTALEREMKLFSQSKKMAARAETGRRSRMARELEASGRRQLYSPLMAVARIVSRPGLEFKPEEADEIVDILQTGKAEDINDLVIRFEPLQKRRLKVQKRRGKAAYVGAAIGAMTAPFIDDDS